MKVHPNAVLAVYVDGTGQELQREVLTSAAKNRDLTDPDPDFLGPWRVMTVDISCQTQDRDVFKAAIDERLGPEDQDPEITGWAYSVPRATDDRYLRYIFDTRFRVPLELFGEVITNLTEIEPTRCQTVKMLVCGGCIWPCRPKICNGKASCGWAAGCTC